ncbi:hypothetical protein HanRHA438_Chr01g0034021 [Helianthus annuus]|nr:hypothetical protein HanRHA438_Chr01g0034021 [Helianthus annuus]
MSRSITVVIYSVKKKKKKKKNFSYEPSTYKNCVNYCIFVCSLY